MLLLALLLGLHTVATSITAAHRLNASEHTLARVRAGQPPVAVAHATCARPVQTGRVGGVPRSLEVSARFFL